MKLSKVRSADGTQIAWRAAGDGPPLILSPPSLCTHRHWSGVEAGLAVFCRPVSWDYRGHGASDAPADASAYTLERVVDDIAAVHEAAGAEPAYLCGLSIGGLISLSYALAQPERVRGLVLVNTGPGFKNPKNRQRWLETWERVAAKLEDVGIEQYLEGRRAIAEILGRTPDSPGARDARDGVLQSSVAGLAHFARGVAAPQPNLTERLAEIRVPALVLTAEEDPAFHAAAELFAARLPQVEGRMIPAAGHPLPLDQPAAFVDAVREFLTAF